MNGKKNLLHIISVISVSLSCLFLFSCIFSPKPDKNTNKPPAGKIEEPTTPQKVINNLQVAFQDLEIDFYERCLHQDFYYRSPSNIDSLDLAWGFSEEISIITNMMEASREIIFSPSEIRTYEEYGVNYPDKPDGAIIAPNNEHPDEKWIICDYYITIDINTKELGDFKVQQDMKFKMFKNPETDLYSIIQWFDETPESTGI
ncbi:hypothetical protein ACFL1R_07920 [Candidatus Latescibacterota bacterium]